MSRQATNASDAMNRKLKLFLCALDRHLQSPEQHAAIALLGQLPFATVNWLTR